jgi:hypothetical protein
MTPQQLDALATKHAIFVSTARHLQHPRNDYRAWRQGWANLHQLVDEIDRMVALHR